MKKMRYFYSRFTRKSLIEDKRMPQNDSLLGRIIAQVEKQCTDNAHIGQLREFALKSSYA